MEKGYWAYLGCVRQGNLGKSEISTRPVYHKLTISIDQFDQINQHITLSSNSTTYIHTGTSQYSHLTVSSFDLRSDCLISTTVVTKVASYWRNPCSNYLVLHQLTRSCLGGEIQGCRTRTHSFKLILDVLGILDHIVNIMPPASINRLQFAVPLI